MAWGPHGEKARSAWCSLELIKGRTPWRAPRTSARRAPRARRAPFVASSSRSPAAERRVARRRPGSRGGPRAREARETARVVADEDRGAAPPAAPRARRPPRRARSRPAGGSSARDRRGARALKKCARANTRRPPPPPRAPHLDSEPLARERLALRRRLARRSHAPAVAAAVPSAVARPPRRACPPARPARGVVVGRARRRRLWSRQRVVCSIARDASRSACATLIPSTWPRAASQFGAMCELLAWQRRATLWRLRTARLRSARRAAGADAARRGGRSAPRYQKGKK